MLDILDFKQIAAATLALLLRRSRMGSPGESTSLWRGGQTVTTGFSRLFVVAVKTQGRRNYWKIRSVKTFLIK